MSPWDESTNPLDARAWPSAPAPEPDFFPPAPPPPPLPVIHAGVYADPGLQARAGVQPGMGWAEGQLLMDQQLAADRARQAAWAPRSPLPSPPPPSPSPSGSAPAPLGRPPAPAAAPLSEAVPDLTYASLDEALGAVREQQQAARDERRTQARPWRQAALALWALVWPVAWALPALWPRGAHRLGGLPAWLLGLGLMAAAVALWRRWAPDAESRALRRLAAWLGRLDPALRARVPGPDEARALEQRAQADGLPLRLRVYAWQATQPRQRGRSHPLGLVLELPSLRLGLPPRADWAREQQPRPRGGVDAFLDRLERQA